MPKHVQCTIQPFNSPSLSLTKQTVYVGFSIKYLDCNLDCENTVFW